VFPPPAHCGVKICGITSPQQCIDIAALGADALGLNFWPKSKRYVSVETVAAWDLHELSCDVIAVMVNPTYQELNKVVALKCITGIQLHGDESPELVGYARHLGPPVIKALQIRDAESLEQISAYDCAAFLLDSYNPGLYGGEGKSFPWELVAEAKRRFPKKRFVLAGGLTPENVADAVQGVQPAAVDVASGVESAPGIKDLEKVAAFIGAVRSI
jgi:phosphoribosylanthranilate isomerase